MAYCSFNLVANNFKIETITTFLQGCGKLLNLIRMHLDVYKNCKPRVMVLTLLKCTGIKERFCHDTRR